ncbi:MAG: glycosyltransferase, partial [bacterium]
LEVVHNFPPASFSGTELYTLNLSKELQKLGHEVTILYPVAITERRPYSLDKSVYQGFEVIQFNVYDPGKPIRSDFHNPEYDGFFRKVLTSSNFDLVHFQHLYGLSATWISVAKNLGLPVFLKIDDMFFFCRQVHLMENNKTYCAGPESLDKCFRCMFSLKIDAPPDEIGEAFRYLGFGEPIYKVFSGQLILCTHRLIS